MASSTRIRVLLSSRCNDIFPGKGGSKLSSIRRMLKKEIESHNILGRPIFEAWINEDAPPADATNDSWETCLQEVRDCDVLIVLSNGNAGWAKKDGDIGICHAEYCEGLSSARGKVRLIALPLVALGSSGSKERDQRFRDELERQTAFRGGEVTTIDELKTRVFEALADAVVVLTQRGVMSSASSRFGMGQALDWTRLDFITRKREMEHVIRSSLMSHTGATAIGGDVVIPLDEKNIGVVVHAIPAAFTVAAAREMVGRPFLRDHERMDLLKNSYGPLHLIACHRGATETQARSLLGFPDAIVVSDEFGIYVADEIQKVQFAFLANCRDPSQSRHALQRFFEWLEQSNEVQLLAARAESRAKIVRAIAAENPKK